MAALDVLKELAFPSQLPHKILANAEVSEVVPTTPMVCFLKVTIDQVIQAVAEARKTAGLKQATVAKKAGISQPAWTLFEKGKLRVSPKKVVAIGAAVGLCIGYTSTRRIVFWPEESSLPQESSNATFVIIISE